MYDNTKQYEEIFLNYILNEIKELEPKTKPLLKKIRFVISSESFGDSKIEKTDKNKYICYQRPLNSYDSPIIVKFVIVHELIHVLYKKRIMLMEDWQREVWINDLIKTKYNLSFPKKIFKKK